MRYECGGKELRLYGRGGALPRGIAAISRVALHEPDWNGTAMRVREQCSGPVLAISISPLLRADARVTFGSATADVRSRRANLIQIQNLSPVQKRTKFRRRSSVVRKRVSNLASRCRTNLASFQSDAIQFASLPRSHPWRLRAQSIVCMSIRKGWRNAIVRFGQQNAVLICQ